MASVEQETMELTGDMSTAATPARQRLLDFLSQSNGSQFVIPVYQRYYTWTTTMTKKNKGRGGKKPSVVQLMDDFENVVTGKNKKHFLGILIYMETALSVSQRELSIIDGQQRLVTIYLLLFALKKIMKAQGVNDQEITDFEYKYFYSNPYVQNRADLKLKLKPQVSDDDVYKKIVSDRLGELTSIERKSNVYLAYQYIYNKLSELVQSYSIERVINCLSQLYIVYIPVSADDYPQKIFESINSTGVELKAPDLIRNLILMPIEDRYQEAFYKDYWKKIEDYITKCSSKESKDLGLFFRCFLSAKNHKLVDVDGVYEAFIDWYAKEQSDIVNKLQDAGESPQDRYEVEKCVLQEIVDHARYYSILFGDVDINSIPADIRDAVKEFKIFPSTMPAPVFLELYNLADKPAESELQITFRQLGEIISLTTTYLMRRQLCDCPTSKITTLFSQILNNVMVDMSRNPDHDIVEVYKKYLVNENKHNSAAMPTDNDMIDKIFNANMYTKKDFVMAFFKKYENYNNRAPVDIAGSSIEHLMPQTSTPQWIQESRARDEAEYNKYLHKLGNLSLGTPHLQARQSNHLWNFKNEVLKDTRHLKLNQDILELNEWTIQEIDNRTLSLIEALNSLYPYFESELPNDVIELCIEQDDINAVASYDTRSKSIIIRKGSVLSDNVVLQDPQHDNIVALRNDLQSSKFIGNSKGRLVFKKDYTFAPQDCGTNYIDLSASILLGKTVSGTKTWIIKYENKPLSEYIQ